MGWPYQQKPPMGWPLDYDSGLIPDAGFWPMLEGSGNKVFDLSGNKQNVTLNGTPVWGAGKYGSVVTFSGDDHGTLTDSALLKPTQFTIVAGVKYSSFTNQPVIFSNNDQADTGDEGFIFGYQGDPGKLRLYVDNTGGGDWVYAELPSALSTGVDYQVVGRYDGVNISLYVDGVWKDDTACANIHYGATHYPKIGYYSSKIQANLEYLYFYNRALFAHEIALLDREPFCMFKDPAEIALLGGYQAVPSGTILPLITTAYMRISA